MLKCLISKRKRKRTTSKQQQYIRRKSPLKICLVVSERLSPWQKRILEFLLVVYSENYFIDGVMNNSHALRTSFHQSETSLASTLPNLKKRPAGRVASDCLPSDLIGSWEAGWTAD